MVQEEYKLQLSLIKMAVSLANITAKLGFLSTCILLGVIPNGFIIKFSLQSSLPKEDSKVMDASIESLLSKTSIGLLDVTKDAESLKASMIINKIQDTFAQVSVDKHSVMNQTLSKFKRILILRTKLLSKKLSKLVNGFSPHAILDIDEEVKELESKLVISEIQPVSLSPSNSLDWFDLDNFPLLPPPVNKRPDWSPDVSTICLVPSSPAQPPPPSPPQPSPPPPPMPKRVLRPRISKQSSSLQGGNNLPPPTSSPPRIVSTATPISNSSRVSQETPSSIETIQDS